MEETFQRLVIGAMVAGQLNDYECDILLQMEGVPDMLRPFQGLVAALERDALRKRLQKGAELIESATDPMEVSKYKHLYNAIEKKYNEVAKQCKNYGL